MKRSLTLGVAALAMFSSAGSARATESFIKNDMKEVVSEFNQSKLEGKMFRALNGLMESAQKDLIKAGFDTEAAVLVSDWNVVLQASLLEFGVLDLGDHRPLSQWLAKTYDKLERLLGKRILHWSRYDDLKIFNYAIPVVFNPSGDSLTGEKWDSTEYGKHFVPFSGAVSYWSSLVACNAATVGWVGYLCGTVAEAPRYVVEKWVAPRISKRVYAAATSCHRGMPQAFDERELEDLLEAAPVQTQQ